MQVVAYLIRTRHGSGQSPQVVDRLTFDAGVARRAEESGSVIEALVTVTEAHRQLAKAVEQTRLEMKLAEKADAMWVTDLIVEFPKESELALVEDSVSKCGYQKLENALKALLHEHADPVKRKRKEFGKAVEQTRREILEKANGGRR